MLFLAALLATADVTSVPCADASSLRAAIASAHCATLRIGAHPKGRVGLASRICRRPGDDDVVEERGVVDLDSRRFTFVRAPFTPPEAVDHTMDGGAESCAVLDEERAPPFAATDAVSRVLREPRLARCFFDAGGAFGEHPLWGWRSELTHHTHGVPDGHAAIAWSASGRFVALHRFTDAHWKAAVLVIESSVVDTRTLAFVEEARVFVPRFVGDVAEVLVAGDDPDCAPTTWAALLLNDTTCCASPYGVGPAIQSARVDFATSPPTLRVLGPRRPVDDMR